MTTSAPSVNRAGRTTPVKPAPAAPSPAASRSQALASHFGDDVPECVVSTLAYLIPTLRQNRKLWLALKRSVETP